MPTLSQLAPEKVATPETVVVERIEVTPLLREEQVAVILNVAVKTLQKWRYERKQSGPPYFKIEGHLVRYALADLQQYIAGKKQTS